MSPPHAHHSDHVTPYDRLAWTNEEVERLLATGEHERELVAYFGAEEYRELVRLAKLANHPVPEGAPRVFIVPGIMGSQLGFARRAPLPNDILWLDPIDIGIGRLHTLRLPGEAPVISLGAVLYTYLRLKLHLHAAGFAPVLYHYDWRLGIDELGRGLAAQLAGESLERLMIVAHSMGGLVSRAAMALSDSARIARLVLLGTPNFGSFAPVQALRGTYAVVRKISRLVELESAEGLASGIFSTFPSLYHLLPTNGRAGTLDLFDPGAWPARGPSPRPELLARGREIEGLLAAPDARVATIVGVGQETVTAVARHGDDFVYTITRRGDGTVPTFCAELPGANTYYTPVAHSELTRDEAVARAVIDLLRDGSTVRLAKRWTYAGNAQAQISDSELRQTHVAKVDWGALEPDERRVFLQTLNEPPRLRLRTP